MGKELLMPRGWIELLSFLLVEKAARLSFSRFVHDNFLGCCEDGRKVTEDVESFPVPQSSVGNFQAQSVAGSLMTRRWYYLLSMSIPSYATLED